MARQPKSIWLRALDLPLICAAVTTVAFYAFLWQQPELGKLLGPYTSEHAVEYVIVALFIWGLFDIFFKIIDFPREVYSMRQDWLPPRSGRVPPAAAAELLAGLRAFSQTLLNSRIGQRLEQALGFVVERDSTEGYSEHLRYLADQDANESQTNYTLVRFIIAIAPILGFFGTVVHFGTALGGFSLEAIDKNLPALVSDMGTAFHTTVVALGTAVTMTFLLFLCERVERNLLASTDRYVEVELLNRFEERDASMTPFLASIQASNQEALKVIAGTIQKQVTVWSQSLERLFQQFDGRQKQEVTHWREALSELHKRHETYDSQREQRLAQTLSLVDARQDKHLATIQSALEKALTVRDSIGELAKNLNSIARGEGRLVELQATLTDNLRVLHETRQIDEAVHGLTAAIHLLTARNRQIGVHGDDAAAA